MSGFSLHKMDCDGEPQPQWLLYFPTCGSRPVVIADGNMAELFADFVRQGGSLPSDTIESENGDGQRGLF